MLFFFDQDDQIAGGAAPFAGITSAPYAELHAFLYARGNIDGYRLFAINAAFALAYRAFGGDDGTFSIAGRTGGDCLHLAEEGVADTTYLAAAAAGRAGLNAVLVFGAAPAAGRTKDVFFYLDIF